MEDRKEPQGGRPRDRAHDVRSIAALKYSLGSVRLHCSHGDPHPSARNCEIDRADRRVPRDMADGHGRVPALWRHWLRQPGPASRPAGAAEGPSAITSPSRIVGGWCAASAYSRVALDGGVVKVGIVVKDHLAVTIYKIAAIGAGRCRVAACDLLDDRALHEGVLSLDTELAVHRPLSFGCKFLIGPRLARTSAERDQAPDDDDQIPVQRLSPHLQPVAMIPCRVGVPCRLTMGQTSSLREARKSKWPAKNGGGKPHGAKPISDGSSPPLRRPAFVITVSRSRWMAACPLWSATQLRRLGAAIRAMTSFAQNGCIHRSGLDAG